MSDETDTTPRYHHEILVGQSRYILTEYEGKPLTPGKPSAIRKRSRTRMSEELKREIVAAIGRLRPADAAPRD